MKKITTTLIFTGFLAFTCTSVTSCKVKEGCGLEEKYAPKVDKSGKMSSKRGKSNLFSKKQRKRMRG
jgi:hypothetical protein